MSKILLDTHIIIWAIAGDEQLSAEAAAMIRDMKNKVYYSVVSPWETEIKHMAHPDTFSLSGEKMIEYCNETGFEPLPVKNAHILKLKTLTRDLKAPVHKDPFDRIMLSQAKAEGMLFLTHDSLLPYYNEDFIMSV